MAKKTWVKIKAGLFRDPKHRQAMADGVWLYGYLIDHADWDTGIVDPFKDGDCAEEMCASLAWVRKYRRKLEAAGYIKCTQLGQKGLRITIIKWTNPRSYDGEVINEPDQSDTPVTLSNSDQSDTVQSGMQSDTQSDTQSVSPVPLSCTQVVPTPHTTDQESIKTQRKTREADPIFDAVALGSFQINNSSLVTGKGGRIGKLSAWLKTHNQTAEQITAFYEWYRGEYPDINPPRDLGKFSEHYLKYMAAGKAPHGGPTVIRLYDPSSLTQEAA